MNSPSKQTDNISNAMVLIAKKLDVKFVFKGSPISSEKVFNAAGLLSRLTRRANQLSELCLGYTLGETIYQEEAGLAGERIIFDDLVPNPLRVIFLTNSLFDLLEEGSAGKIINLDELLND